jgi:hypothetical protein
MFCAGVAAAPDNQASSLDGWRFEREIAKIALFADGRSWLITICQTMSEDAVDRMPVCWAQAWGLVGGFEFGGEMETEWRKRAESGQWTAVLCATTPAMGPSTCVTGFMKFLVGIVSPG